MSEREAYIEETKRRIADWGEAAARLHRAAAREDDEARRQDMLAEADDLARRRDEAEARIARMEETPGPEALFAEDEDGAEGRTVQEARKRARGPTR